MTYIVDQIKLNNIMIADMLLYVYSEMKKTIQHKIAGQHEWKVYNLLQ